MFFNNFCFLREPINFCSSSHTGAACATGVAWQLWCIADRAGRLRPSCIVSPMPAPLTFSKGRARNRRGFPVAGCRARASLGAALQQQTPRSLERVAEAPVAIGDAQRLPHPTRTPHRETPSQLQHVATTVAADVQHGVSA